jgi:hypothetical protein
MTKEINRIVDQKISTVAEQIVSQGSETGGNSSNIITINKNKIRKSNGIETYRIGRSGDCAIQIGTCTTTDMISREHAEISIDRTNATLRVSDIGSLHGIQVRLREDTNSFKSSENDNDATKTSSLLLIGAREVGSRIGNIQLGQHEPYLLDLREKWEIILAPKDISTPYSFHNLVIKCDGSGNLTAHQLHPETRMLGRRPIPGFSIKVPIPESTSPELARGATGASIARFNADEYHKAL